MEIQKKSRYIFLLLFIFLFISCSNHVILTKAERAYLNNTKNITVGMLIYYPPDIFVNNNGEVNGILVDYFSLLEKKISHSFKKRYYTNWQELLNDSKLGIVDIVVEIQETEDRSEYLTFTEAIFSSRHIVIANQTKEFNSLESLKGKSVAVVEDYSIEEYLSKNHPEINVLPQSNEIECISLLTNNKVDAFISLESMANYLITKLGIKDVKTHFSLDYVNKLGIGINKENTILTNIINKANNKITLEERRSILNNWLYDIHEPSYKRLNFLDLVLYTLILILIIALIYIIILNSKIKAIRN